MCQICEKKTAEESFGQEIIFFERIKQESASDIFVSLQIDPDNKELVLGAGTTDGELDEEFTRAIKFCPFCGKAI